jgi:hypothetical protein
MDALLVQGETLRMSEDHFAAARTPFAFHIADGLRYPIDDNILGNCGRPIIFLEAVCAQHTFTLQVYP